MRRLPRAALWCALVALLNAVVWSLVTPPFQAPDETGHVSYLQYLAETGNVPRDPGAGVFSDEQVRTLESLAFSSLVGRVRERALITQVQDRALDDVEKSSLDRVGEGGTLESSSQPPLYYALESIVYHASPSQDLIDRLWLMRLLSSLMVAATVLFVYLFLRELLPGHPWTWTVGALAVAFQPVLGFIGSGVTPDTLLFTASAALFFALARAFRRGLTVSRGVGIGLALAVGALAKTNFLALVPGALLGLAVLALRRHGAEPPARPAYNGGPRSPADVERSQRLRGALVAIAIPAAAGIAYVLLNLLVWDRSAWGGGAEIAATVASGQDSLTGGAITLSEQISYTWQLYLPRLPFMTDQFAYFPPWQTWFKGTIGVFGWLDTPFNAWVYRLALIVFAALAALLAAGLYRYRAVVGGRLPELAVYAVMVLGLMASIGVLGLRYFRDTGSTFEQARYLLPFLPLYAAALATAALGAGPRWAKPVGVAIVVLAAAHGLFSQLLTIARFYG